MNPAGVTLLSLALASAGFVLLSLTMARHATKALGGMLRRSRRRLAAVAGWCLLLASLACCLHATSWGNALVTWSGLLTLAALPLSLGLEQSPRATLVAGSLTALCAAGLLTLMF